MATKPTGKPKGGPQPNSGRPTKAILDIKRELLTGPVTFEEKVTAAEYAFRLFVTTMTDKATPIDLRLDCGREIMNRSWGKPTQKTELSGKDGIALEHTVIVLPANNRKDDA